MTTDLATRTDATIAVAKPRTPTKATEIAAALAEQGHTYLTPGPVPGTAWTGDAASPLLLRLDGKVTPAMRKAQTRAREIIDALRMGGEMVYTAGAYRESVTLILPAVPQHKDGEAASRFSMGRAPLDSTAQRVTVPFDIQKPLKVERIWVAGEVPQAEVKPRRAPRRRSQLVSA